MSQADVSQKTPDRHEVFLAVHFFPALVTECDVREGEGGRDGQTDGQMNRDRETEKNGDRLGLG